MKIHHLALRASDYLKTAAFYQEILGLKSVHHQIDYSIWLESGQNIIMIEKSSEDEADYPKRSKELICFDADSKQKEMISEKLRQKGIQIEEKSEKTIYFRDPDGRKIAISDFNFNEYLQSKQSN